VVILTTFELDEYVFEAIRSGPASSWSKTPSRTSWCKPSAWWPERRPAVPKRHPAADRRVRGPSQRACDPGGLEELTDRKQEVLALVGTGLSDDEIAEQLYVSPATAKTHVSRAMIKLQARDRAQLVVIAYEQGLVRPGWRA
jgi:DNA-binding NarL/FixJ family response regulator